MKNFHAGPVSLWLKNSQGPSFPALESDSTADILILGGGIAGLSTAWFLLELGVPGESILLLEAKKVGGRASGRNAGFLLTDLAEPYARMREAIGEKARRLRLLSARNQELMIAVADELHLPWEFDRGGVLVVAASDAEDADCQASAQALQADKFDVRYLSCESTTKRLGFATPWGSLWDPLGGGCQPAVFVHGLASACARRGVRIFENACATKLQSTPSGDLKVSVEGPSSATVSVIATRAVNALNAYAPLLDVSLSHLVAPFRGQMLSFPPTQPRLLKSVVYRNHGFEYFRQHPDGRFTFGGFRQTAVAEETGFEEMTNQSVQKGLEDFARLCYPQLKDVEPDARWAGTMGFSLDGLPMVGQHPSRSGVILNLGFTGHGFGLAMELSRMTAQLLLEGTAPDTDLFTPRRVS